MMINAARTNRSLLPLIDACSKTITRELHEVKSQECFYSFYVTYQLNSYIIPNSMLAAAAITYRLNILHILHIAHTD